MLATGDKSYYIFDPVQFKEFGYNFYQGDDFYYRYQSTRKLLSESIYIPFGPNCATRQGFLNFIKHIGKRRFTKVTIDLPMIYCKRREKDIVDILLKNGYRKNPYIHQDEETIIFKKEEFIVRSKLMNKVRYGERRSDVVVKHNLNEAELKEIYKIYLFASRRIGFKPKKIAVFEKLSESCIAVLAFSKEGGMQGFVIGYLFNAYACDFYNKDASKILSVVFTAESEGGRKNKIGHMMHYHLFKEAFEGYGVDIIDFHGASRTKNRTYISFKSEFSKNFYSLPGSFTKTKIL